MSAPNAVASGARSPAARPDVVVIGGSAGALDALGRLLTALPGTCDVPIVVVLHVPRQRSSGLARAIGRFTSAPVVEIEDKTPLAAGAVHVAPPDYHVLVERGSAVHLALSIDAPVHFSIPSIDVLFESAADACADAVAAVVLSGANDDGAQGLAAVIAAGGRGFVQAPESALVRTMPEAAIALAPGATVLPPEGIATALDRLAAAGAAR